VSGESVSIGAFARLSRLSVGACAITPSLSCSSQRPWTSAADLFPREIDERIQIAVCAELVGRTSADEETLPGVVGATTTHVGLDQHPGR
jgi:hypothetical protein